MNRRLFALMATTCIASLVPATAAMAQSAPAAPEADEDQDQILITGSLIRGVSPAGAETISITPEDITESGALTVQDALAKVPQLSFFNRQPTSGNDMGVGQRQPPQQPQIHGLPTLILLDGHRIASAGAGGGGAATSVDPSIIPTGALGGIEIVADGGSATYGSDAVGGVINLVTLRRFDGIKADGSFTFADDYQAWQGNLTAGTTWDTGSIYLSYSYLQSDGLLGANRPFIEQNPLIVTCNPATVTANAGGGATAVQYTYTGVDASGRPTSYVTGPQRCSRYATESVLPAQEMHSVFGGFSQDLGDGYSVDVRGFWSKRDSTSYNAFALVTNANIPATNPFYTITPAQVGTTRTQRVDFSLAPAVGPNLPTTTALDTAGFNIEFKAPLFGDFQLSMLGNYSRSKFDSFAYEGANTTLLAQALARTDPLTALNPYSPAATAGSTLVAQQIANRPTTAQGILRQTQARLVVDGSLFSMPGGDVKVAVGGEVIYESFGAFSRINDYTGALFGAETRFAGTRTVKSAFGEIEIPLVSPSSNAGIHELRLSAAGRYDEYSDFGDTFNPRFAITFKPTEWLAFRGTYSKSFVAPSLPQLFTPLGIVHSNTAFILPPGATNILILTGGNPTLKPQKAETWSLGLDIEIPGLEGFKASVTYYDVKFKDRLANAPFTQTALFYTPTYASFYLANPTQAQVLAFAGGPATFTGLANCPTLASLYDAAGTCPAASRNPAYVTSSRAGNLSAETNRGWDFSASYVVPTGFGSIDFGVAGNYVIQRDVAADGIVFTNALLTESRFRGTASLGATVGNFRILGTLLHTSSFGLPTNATTQTRVNAYDTVDLFLSYNFGDQGMLADTELTLQVTNLFDVLPPRNLTASTGYAPGNILLRSVQVGLKKKF